MALSCLRERFLPRDFRDGFAFQRAATGCSPGSWLSDECLTLVYQQMQKTAHAVVPDNILLLEAGTSQLLAASSPVDAREGAFQLAGVNSTSYGVSHRDLILCPISDKFAAVADEGSHWTLLACWPYTGPTVQLTTSLGIVCIWILSIETAQPMLRGPSSWQRLCLETAPR